MPRTDRPSAPHSLQVCSSSSSAGAYDASDELFEEQLAAATDSLMARFSATRLRTRQRLLLFVAVASVLVLLPFLTLSVFAGLEDGGRSSALTVPGSHGETTGWRG